MLVYSMFDGDQDMHVAWKQHDVYSDALRIISNTCNRLTHSSKIILDIDMPPKWGNIECFDHRTLQGAHDILAAAWRSRNDLRQMVFPLIGNTDKEFDNSYENLWLDWLMKEVEKWIWQPELVRYVQIILENQNKPNGYKAEALLGRALLRRFNDVAWNLSVINAYNADT